MKRPFQAAIIAAVVAVVTVAAAPRTATPPSNVELANAAANVAQAALGCAQRAEFVADQLLVRRPRDPKDPLHDKYYAESLKERERSVELFSKAHKCVREAIDLYERAKSGN